MAPRQERKKNRHESDQTRTPVLEPLEPRVLLAVTAAIDQGLLTRVDQLAPTYYCPSWNVSLEQFKAWVITIARGEGNRGGYTAQSQGRPGSDRFYHTAAGSGFSFSTGIGPFQLDRGGRTENWGYWATIDKLDPAQSVESVLRYHMNTFGPGSTLNTFAQGSPWYAVNPNQDGGDPSGHWNAVTDTSWSVQSSGVVSLDWTGIEGQLASNASAPTFRYSNNVQDLGVREWTIDAADGLTTESGQQVRFEGSFETWLITARDWSGQSLFDYYYTRNNAVEVWVLSNPADPTYAYRYVFIRDYTTGPLPEWRSTNHSGQTLASTALNPVADSAALSLSVSPSTFAENDPYSVAVGTVTRSGPTTSALTVNLESSDTSEATVPATVTIPGGATYQNFLVSPVDDLEYDGTRIVTITASAAGYDSGSFSVQVTDNETASLALSVSPSTFAENDPYSVAVGTVTRNGPTTSSLIVNLQSSDTTEVTVPRTVTIPAGASYQDFLVSPVDDTIVDGTQTVAITASATGYQSASASVAVTDNDQPTIVVDVIVVDGDVGEPSNNGTYRIERSGVTASALDVSFGVEGDAIRGLDYWLKVAGVLLTGYVVTIPAGQTSVDVTVEVRDDTAVEVFPESVVLTLLGGSGYSVGTPRSQSVYIVDDDRPPPQIAWSTYLGGNASDGAYGVAIDAAGNAFVTGKTSSSGWVPAGLDSTLDGYDDAFVAKLSPAGQLVWATYLGGSNGEYGFGIAVDSAGNVFVTGSTSSPGWVSGGFDTDLGGTEDAFVAKLSPTGQVLWSTYLGGSAGWGWDSGTGITVDPTGNVLVTGDTKCPGWVSGGFDLTLDGESDGFVAKLTPGGQLLWSTYVGGSDRDSSASIVTDGAGNALVIGSTASAGWVSGGFDTDYNDSQDAFVAKLSPTGQMLWSTYLGGANGESGSSIAVDGAGNVLVTGSTSSPGWVSGGFDSDYGGMSDAFVAKLSRDGAHVWSTYLGGEKSDGAADVAVDGAGSAVLCGITESSGWVSGPIDTTLDGSCDAFVAKLSASCQMLESAYLGGANAEGGFAIGLDPAGNAVVAGYTSSPGWVSGGCDAIYGGESDAFMAKITAFGAPQLLAPALVGPGNTSLPGQTVPTTQPVLQWQVVASADQCGLYVVGANPDGSTGPAVFDSLGLGITIPGTSSSYQLPSGYLENSHDYCWYMNSRSAVGWSTIYGSPLFFRIDVPDRPPEITVLLDGVPISDGETTPIDIGTVQQGAEGPRKTFTVRNDGDQPLTLTTPFADLPHFIVGEPDRITLGLGECTTFAVTLKTDAAWSGSETVSFVSNDSDENPFDFVVSGRVEPNPAQISGGHVFYNNSKWDGYDPGAGESDDDAIAPDKWALRPGETATFDNYTSYTRGINGVMVDVDNLSFPLDVSAADFEFRVGNDNDPASWAELGAAVDVSVRVGAGVDGSDRVTLIFPDGAVANTWLQVTMRPTMNTGLPEADVFYVGNLCGECNGDGAVDFRDYLRVKAALAGLGDGGEDFDCDGGMDGGDLSAFEGGFGESICLSWTAPAAPAPPVSEDAAVREEQPHEIASAPAAPATEDGVGTVPDPAALLTGWGDDPPALPAAAPWIQPSGRVPVLSGNGAFAVPSEPLALPAAPGPAGPTGLALQGSPLAAVPELVGEGDAAEGEPARLGIPVLDALGMVDLLAVPLPAGV